MKQGKGKGSPLNDIDLSISSFPSKLGFDPLMVTTNTTLLITLSCPFLSLKNSFKSDASKNQKSVRALPRENWFIFGFL